MLKCNRCLIDKSIPGADIKDGMCSYCRMHDRFEKQYTIDNIKLQKLIKKIKKTGKRRSYDCLIGISGGCDSSYLLYLAVKKFNLHPLVVHFDNRLNTKCAENNMRNLVDFLNVDFIRYQLPKKTYNELNRAFFESSVSDADIPNDMAMLAIFKKVARQFGIKFIFNGHSFRTEGSNPLSWTYMDAKYIQSVYRSFWNKPLVGFPLLTVLEQLKAGFLGIKEIRLLNYIDYRKDDAKKVLRENVDWEDYGGHHLENKYTAFISSYFLPKKFGIDKRIIEYSALVRSGQLTREKAEKMLKKEPNLPNNILKEIKQKYSNFDNIMKSKSKKSFQDFETYHKLFKRYKFLIWIGSKLQLLPKTFYIKYAKKNSNEK